ncbi:hypothetical protein KVR01_011502 [Diaporthe batatas]|uniref:uncharacterized protein n=1 Tax=Diaporthe batatas TaxID=748121 RepID=UPI001D05314C|nr:uncharacterized protein KVR01_011502 [Diaporthe batatas]KAG8158380.1 hypothetical protein KVR01_011502 [Diaporthe batatas]
MIINVDENSLPTSVIVPEQEAGILFKWASLGSFTLGNESVPSWPIVFADFPFNSSRQQGYGWVPMPDVNLTSGPESHLNYTDEYDNSEGVGLPRWRWVPVPVEFVSDEDGESVRQRRSVDRDWPFPPKYKGGDKKGNHTRLTDWLPFPPKHKGGDKKINRTRLPDWHEYPPKFKAGDKGINRGGLTHWYPGYKGGDKNKTFKELLDDFKHRFGNHTAHRNSTAAHDRTAGQVLRDVLDQLKDRAHNHTTHRNHTHAHGRPARPHTLKDLLDDLKHRGHNHTTDRNHTHAHGRPARPHTLKDLLDDLKHRGHNQTTHRNSTGHIAPRSDPLEVAEDVTSVIGKVLGVIFKIIHEAEAQQAAHANHHA